ncbi:hypothetical protein ACFYNZ_06480 [Streptomyces kebangsaanensis]|uniref:Uncharacterized protein n=1 Tax=Streptomyces kebangsaanensis TaxID=864058 RepID=A0ABW6KMX8_9ACTN
MVLPAAGARTGRADAPVRRARACGPRAEPAGPEHGSPGARTRAARLVPHQAVAGEWKAGGDLAAVRLRDGRRPGAVSAEGTPRRITEQAAARGGGPWE